MRQKGMESQNLKHIPVNGFFLRNLLLFPQLSFCSHSTLAILRRSVPFFIGLNGENKTQLNGFVLF